MIADCVPSTDGHLLHYFQFKTATWQTTPTATDGVGRKLAVAAAAAAAATTTVSVDILTAPHTRINQ
jgi:phosphoribosylaminoimidazole (AIR) synthetase